MSAIPVGVSSNSIVSPVPEKSSPSTGMNEVSYREVRTGNLISGLEMVRQWKSCRRNMILVMSGVNNTPMQSY